MTGKQAVQTSLQCKHSKDLQKSTLSLHLSMSGRALERPKWIWKSGCRYSRQGFTAPPLPTCSPLQIITILGLIIHWFWQWVPAGISGLHLSSPQEPSKWIVRFFLARKESVGLANAASMLNISPCTQKNPRQRSSWGGRPGETSSLAYSQACSGSGFAANTPRCRVKWKGVLHLQPNFSWLLWWDVSDARNTEH